MGAVDVVPFIPVRGIEVAEAIGIARRFGVFLGGLGVPVYYYEDAATRPERRAKAARPTARISARGSMRRWRRSCRTRPGCPDEGPAGFNARSGATVTGVRFPLVAFNVNLRTADLSIAERIARAVRHINGGFRYVRAIGLALEEQGMVQVSMNLVNYARTPIPRVLETVRSEAARHGVAVAGTELVGPVPLAALEEVVKHYLQAHDFKMEQIIETALLE